MQYLNMRGLPDDLCMNGNPFCDHDDDDDNDTDRHSSMYLYIFPFKYGISKIIFDPFSGISIFGLLNC